MTDEKSPTLFISYSWDDADHQEWVRTLAFRLVENGVSVKLDQWNVQPGDSLTAFMETQLAECDRTIIVCTPNYAKKSIERKGGVGYEQQIISGHIAAGVERRRFIPIVRTGSFVPGPDCAIPSHFLGIMAIDMREGPNSDDSFEVLLRSIYKEPKHQPPVIGLKPDFSNPETKPSRTVRLPSFEFDGWELQSGVASAENHPETFHIPTADERNDIKLGDIVKLHFAIAAEDENDPENTEIFHERMWVQVKGNIGPYIWGVLDNVPSFGNEHPDLHFRSEVIFLPEHIISIAE